MSKRGLSGKLRKALAVFLSCAMVVSSWPVSALAETLAESDQATVYEEAVPSSEADEDDLFAAYAQQRFDAELPTTTSGSNVALKAKAVHHLEDVNDAVLDTLRKRVAEVAAGTITSTKFEIPIYGLYGTRWVADDLGLDAVCDQYGAATEEAKTAAAEKLRLDLDAILNALLADCPYELYWYDKTSATTLGMSYDFVIEPNEDIGPELVATGTYTISLPVASEYAAGEFEVTSTGAAAIQTAIDEAKGIVETVKADESLDTIYQKLEALKDAICEEVSYNEAAAQDGMPYGNPWQLIWVFDGDPTTNVVCEGYSKAFQYLCDLASFDNVSCISVSGTTNAGTGAGDHMWNILKMDDGNSYLVDVTNCDEGSIAYPDKLFVAYTTQGSPDASYVFTVDGTDIEYVYDEETQTTFAANELTIADTAYAGSPETPSTVMVNLYVSQGTDSAGNPIGNAYAVDVNGNEFESIWVPAATYVELHAIPDEGYEFSHWSIGDVEGNEVGESLGLTYISDNDDVAYFHLPEYAVFVRPVYTPTSGVELPSLTGGHIELNDAYWYTEGPDSTYYLYPFEFEPVIRVYDADGNFVDSSQYEMSFSGSWTEPGPMTITATAIEGMDYEGVLSQDITISQYPIDEDPYSIINVYGLFDVAANAYDDVGNYIRPDIYVEFNGSDITGLLDITYQNADVLGEATVTITGLTGSAFGGSLSYIYDNGYSMAHVHAYWNGAELSDDNMVLTSDEYQNLIDNPYFLEAWYQGPNTGTGLVLDADYTLDVSEVVDGAGLVTLTAIDGGACYGSKSFPITVVDGPIDISAAEVTLSCDTYLSTESARPEIIKLVVPVGDVQRTVTDTSQFDVTYGEPQDDGIATVTITSREDSGVFTGSTTTTYTVVDVADVNPNDYNVSWRAFDQLYDITVVDVLRPVYLYKGSAIEPQFSLVLSIPTSDESARNVELAPEDLHVTYLDNDAPGTATAQVYLAEGAAHHVDIKYDITEVADLGIIQPQLQYQSAYVDQDNIGTVEPQFNMPADLVEGTDYTLAYRYFDADDSLAESPTIGGMVEVTATGIGTRCTGGVVRSVPILAGVKFESVTPSTDSIVYRGRTAYPEYLTVIASDGSSYDINLWDYDPQKNAFITNYNWILVSLEDASNYDKAGAKSLIISNNINDIAGNMLLNETTCSYTVEALDLSAYAVQQDLGVVGEKYTRPDPRPEILVQSEGMEWTLQEGVDYTIDWEYYEDGTGGQAIVTGLGNYTGTMYYPFTLFSKVNLAEAVFTPSINGIAIEGNEIPYLGLDPFNSLGGIATHELYDAKGNYISPYDCDISFTGGWDVGDTITVTITSPIDTLYEGELVKQYTIVPYDVEANAYGLCFADELADVPANAAAADGKFYPDDNAIRVTFNALSDNPVITDQFDISYEQNDSIGTGYAILTAKDESNFTGTLRVPFGIGYDLNDGNSDVYSMLNGMSLNGGQPLLSAEEYAQIAKAPYEHFVIYYGYQGPLVPNEDYLIEAGDVAEDGTATITVSAIEGGRCYGSREISVAVAAGKISISESSVELSRSTFLSLEDSFVPEVSRIRVSATGGTRWYYPASDDVAVSEPDASGQITVTITVPENDPTFTGTATATATVIPAEEYELTADNTQCYAIDYLYQEYDEESMESLPVYRLVDGGAQAQFELSVLVDGDSETGTWVRIDQDDQYITYDNNTVAGLATAHIHLATGSPYAVDRNFKVTDTIDLSMVNFALEQDVYYADPAIAADNPIIPTVVAPDYVTESDYEISNIVYRDADWNESDVMVSPGSIELTLTATGEGFVGQAILSAYVQAPEHMTELVVDSSPDSLVYTGREMVPSMLVLHTESGSVYYIYTSKNYDMDTFEAECDGTELELTLSDDLVSVGEKSLTISDSTGRFVGTATVAYEVTKCQISENSFTYSEIGTDLGTQGREPKITNAHVFGYYGDQELVEGRDYELSYAYAEDGLNAVMTISGINGYAGSVEVPFTIAAKPISLDGAQIGVEGTYTYDGSAIEPSVSNVIVTLDGSRIDSSSYVVSFQNNVNAGEATVIVTGEGGYTGTATGSYTIAPRQLADGVEIADIANQYYTGAAIEPQVTASFAGLELAEGVDYAVTFQNNVDMGDNTATIVLEGKGNYAGTLTKTFSIVPVLATSVTVNDPGIALQSIGAKMMLTATVEPGNATNKTVTWSTSDASVATVDPQTGVVTAVAAGKATIAATASDGGGASSAFEVVVGIDKGDGTDPVIPNLAVEQPVVPAAEEVVDSETGETELVEKEDGNLLLNTGTVEIATVDKQSDPDVTEVTEAAVVHVTATPAEGYEFDSWIVTNQDGTDVTEEIGIVENENDLKPVDDNASGVNAVFSRIATNGRMLTGSLIKAASADAVVTGDPVDGYFHMPGYGIVVTARFKAAYAPVESVTLSANTLDFVMGNAEEPVALTASIAPENATNQEVAWSSSNEAVATVDQNGIVTPVSKGAATITATVRDGEEAKTATCEVIVKQVIQVPAANNGLVYNGQSQTGVPAGNGYSVTNGTAVNAGTYTATVKLDNYLMWSDGSVANKAITWSIAQKAATVTANNASKTYGAKDPALTAKVNGLVGKDTVNYAISRKSGENAGTYAISVAGTQNQGNYTVTFKGATFTIARAEVAAPTGKTLTYNGKAQTGVATATGYAVTGGSATNAGSYKATVRLDANHAWTDGSTADKSIAWSIAAANLSSASMTIANQTYTGKALTPAPTVKVGSTTLKSGTDYTVTYKNNVSVGTATVNVTGKGNYTGGKSTTFKISAVNLSGAIISGIPAQTYQGKALTPKPTVKVGSTTLKEGSDYTLSYANNAKAGTGTVTATGKGNYTGTKTVTFKINQNQPKWDRIYGQTALDTGQAVVRAENRTVFEDGRGGTVIVATSGGYWDALAASGLAGRLDAPVLITPKDSLCQQTRDEIARLKPKTILLMGGSLAVSNTVENQLRGLCSDFKRVYGNAAPDTAVKIYDEAIKRGASWGNTAIVATANGYWDALSIAPYAFAKGAPVFLTTYSSVVSGRTLPASALEAIKKGGFSRVVIVGGELAVPASVESQLKGIGVKAIVRQYGQNAIDTSAAIAKFEINEGMGVSNMAIATGKGYWDALTGAAVCGKRNSVLVLSNPGQYQAIDAVYNRDKVVLGHIFGGELVVPKATMEYVMAK